MESGARIRAVIFDMDGVLCDSEALINLAAVKMFRERGLTVQPEDFLPFVGAGENRYLGGVAERYAHALNIPEAKKRTYEIYLSLVPERLEAFPGAVELVRSCRAAGLKIAIASSADRIKVEANLRKIGLPPETWDVIVTGEDVGARKPAPDIFLDAAGKLELAPAECVVVEDAVHGIEAARAAGMMCVAVAQTFPAEKLEGANLVRTAIAQVNIGDLLGEFSDNQPPPLPTPKPWGFWASLGLGCLAAGVWMLVQGVIAGIGVVIGAISNKGEFNVEFLSSNGLLLCITTLVGAPVAMGMSWFFATIRKGAVPTEYLALRPVSGRELLRWGFYLVGLILLSDLITLSLERPLVPDVMVEMYKSTTFRPLFWLAIVVAAPLAEEPLFRGFMFRGMAESRLGVGGTIVLTSFLWSMLHLQYDWYGIVSVFVIGLLLGWVRHRTGSLYAPMALHGFSNLVATVEAAMLAG